MLILYTERNTYHLSSLAQLPFEHGPTNHSDCADLEYMIFNIIEEAL